MGKYDYFVYMLSKQIEAESEEEDGEQEHAVS
jgi:hypothetical protein